MHVEEIRKSIDEMRRYEGVPLTAIIDMKKMFYNSIWELTEETRNSGANFRDKQFKIDLVKRFFTKAETGIKNIYDGLDSIEKFIDSEPPKFYNDPSVKKWKKHKKNSIIAFGAAGLAAIAGYIIQDAPYGQELIDEILYAGTIASTVLGLYNTRAGKKLDKKKEVIIYKQDIHRYNNIETEVSVGLDRLNANLTEYFIAMSNLTKMFYKGERPLIPLQNTDKNIILYNERMMFFQSNLKNIYQTIEESKIGKEKYHELLDLRLLINKLYHPKIHLKYRQKEIENLNNVIEEE